MGGELNWSALPIICADFGVADVMALAERIAMVREHQKNNLPTA
jgi:hypothetical protein